MFDSWLLALAAYNCGENCVKNAIEQQSVSDFFRLNLPLETERFIFRIATIKLILENPEKYGYQLDPAHAYRPVLFDEVSVDIETPVHITGLAQFLGTNYKTIKETNPELSGDFLPPGKYRLNVAPGLGPRMMTAIESIERENEMKRKRQKLNYYVVMQGDNLTDISKKIGTSVSIIKKNNKIEGTRIYPGQILKIRD